MSQTTQTAIGLSAGVYLLEYTDANGCGGYESVIISQPTAISSTTTVVDASGASFNDGSINMSAIGGTPPYTYQWSNGQSSGNITGLSGGTYSCTITDANGCTFITPSVIITEPSGITSDPISTNDITCDGFNDGSATVVNPSGGAPFSGTSVSNILNWGLTCAGGASFAVQYRVVGTSSWISIPGNNTSSSPYTLTGLTANTAYTCEVYAICGAGDTSVVSSPLNFKSCGSLPIDEKG